MCKNLEVSYFFINLSFRIFFLLLSSCDCYVYFFFSCGSTPSNGNHFWNTTYGTIEKWHTLFFSYLLVVPSIMFFLTLFPFDHLFDQLGIHNCSPIDKFSTICFRNHHSRFVAKILHLIFLIDNGQNCSNSIDILWPHLLYNPPFINVVSI